MRFLVYFLEALRQSGVKLPQLDKLQDRVQASEHPSFEIIFTTLINDIASIPDRVILVLDDYHLIENQAIHNALSFLIENLPAQMHVVITTREDPPLPLYRWRARAEMNELRSNDLRFRNDEAALFFNLTQGLNLSMEDITLLEKRTEGWVTGLQLVALTLKGRKDTAQEIRQFAGDNRYIMDYLVEEILKQQSEDVRQFLLQTSILERFCSSLCDAVTLHSDSGALLECLERENLFLIPLDDKRQWFVIITCSPMCCRPICWQSSPAMFACFTSAPASGSRIMVFWKMPFGTPLNRKTLSRLAL
jgi:LuxR family maltose regulon positive regulatory protein